MCEGENTVHVICNHAMFTILRLSDGGFLLHVDINQMYQEYILDIDLQSNPYSVTYQTADPDRWPASDQTPHEGFSIVFTSVPLSSH